VIKIKELTEKGIVIDHEYKVRYAFDEPRKPDTDHDEHFAAVLRTQTPRLQNMTATHEGEY
jgi:heme-binding NEAT domain protein